ncbi:hypothetical protein [Sorangium sp. So ce381]|uniref:hypothetical protein n=1 Tax=Sorangium sp. So ce381 TaxID=3133307 RepID=UPI003F5BD3B3
MTIASIQTTKIAAHENTNMSDKIATNTPTATSTDMHSCSICRKPIPFEAAVCTECESVQFSYRWHAVARRLAAVLLVPAMAWTAVAYYQRTESDRETTQAAAARVTEELQEVLALASDFQTAFETLGTNCTEAATTSTQTCLAEYTKRIVQLDDLVGRLSWKTGILPLGPTAYDAHQTWKDAYWLAAPKKRATEYGGVRVELKNAFWAMSKDDTLLKCQYDFESSDCGKRVREILDPFKQRTLVMFCEFEVDINESRLALFESLSSSTASRNLTTKMRKHVGQSWCGNFVHERRQKNNKD